MEQSVAKSLADGESELLLSSLASVLESVGNYPGQLDPALSDLVEVVMAQQAQHGNLLIDLTRTKGLDPQRRSAVRGKVTSAKLVELCRGEGLVKISIRADARVREIIDLVGVLRARFDWKLPLPDAQNLRRRLLCRQFRGLCFLFRSPRTKRRASDTTGEQPCKARPAAHGLPAEPARRTWKEELLLEEYRILSLEAGLCLMADLMAEVGDNAYRGKALGLFSQLLQKLIKEGNIRAALRLLDVADESACFAQDDDDLEQALEPFRSPNFVRSMLPVLSSVQAEDLSRFLARLGPAIVPTLLKESAHAPSTHLDRVLEQIISVDAEAILGCLSDADLETRDHAFNLLINSGQEIPESCLEQFMSSKSPWLRSRAAKLIRAMDGGGRSAEIALRRLESRDADRRIDGIRRMRTLRGSTYCEILTDWFAKHQRNMGIVERREAFMSIVIVGGESCRDFLLHWAQGDLSSNSRSADAENRLCAIRALGKLSSEESTAALQELCKSPDQTVSDAAREALASRQD